MPLLELDGGEWRATNRELPAFALPEAPNADAIELPADFEPDADTINASAIAIRFDAFNDGRGLSLAVLLRERLGFTGRLYAVGEVHEDVLHYMARCGFDALMLRDGVDADFALTLLEPYSENYQGSVTQPDPSFRRQSRGSSA